jgi:sensor histidine kinase regulating citrate/malate metabolism
MNLAVFKNHTFSIRHKLLICNVFSIVLVMLLSTMLYLNISTRMLDDSTKENLKNMAYVLAKNNMVITALEENSTSEELNEFVDAIVTEENGIDVVTIADMTGKRIYHVDKDLIGGYFVGGDQYDVYEGKNYSSKATGTRGYQFRYFYPIYNRAGTQLGFVMTSTLMSNFTSLQQDIITSSVGLGMIVLFVGITISIVLGINIKDSLLGYEPEQIAALVIQHEEIFDSFDEGLMAIDPYGKIVLINKAARSLLNIPGSEAVGKNIYELAPQLQINETVETGRSSYGQNITFGSVDIVLETMPIIRDGRILGAIALLANRTELRRMAEQLTGVNHYVEALQAYSHEYMNRLHVILGLIQIQAYDEALKYITDISEVQGMISNTIVGRIQNLMLAALILGKISRASEYNIGFNLAPSSYVPVHSKFLSSYSLITIVGNLVENAIDAINALEEEEIPREITLSIVEKEDSLLIILDDTGIGMSDDTVSKILRENYSTKGIHRGTGMTLIKQIIQDSGGHITVESEQGNGTCISIIIEKKRNDLKEGL